MQMVQQFADGMVWVRDNGARYGATAEEFARDYDQPLPQLPKGITERIYEPGKRHALIVGNDVVDGGPMPWPEGDQLIASVFQLIKQQEQREQEIYRAACELVRQQADAAVEHGKALVAKQNAELEAAFEAAKQRAEQQQAGA